jgi:hypothetical protein
VTTVNKRQDAYQKYHHSPSDGLNSGLYIANQVYGTEGISTGSVNLDRALIPTRAPWIRVWVAAPGHGKSTQLRVIAMKEARRLMASTRDQDKNKYVAFISYEEDLGSQELHMVPGLPFTKGDFWRGKVTPDDFIKAMADRVLLPIHMFGLSMYKESLNKHKGDTPPPTIENCIDAMHFLYEKHGLLPSVTVIDYAQEVFVVDQSSDNRTLQIISAMRAIGKLTTDMSCPVELGSQARSDVLDRKDPMPDGNDTEWSKYINQKATMTTGLLRPWNIAGMRNNQILRKGGIPIPRDDGSQYTVPFTPDLVLSRPAKSRPEVLTNTVPYRINMQTLEVIDFPNFFP